MPRHPLNKHCTRGISDFSKKLPWVPRGTGAFKEDLIIDHTALINTGVVRPGNPDASEFYKRLIEDTPEKPRMPWLLPALTEAELTTIRQWIAIGAPNWEVQYDVNFITTDEMFTTIQNHLEGLDDFAKPSARYFTTTHLYNAGESPEALRGYQIALSKLVNSLSWGFVIERPRPIDEKETFSTSICAGMNGTRGRHGRGLKRHIRIPLRSMPRPKPDSSQD